MIAANEKVIENYDWKDLAGKTVKIFVAEPEAEGDLGRVFAKSVVAGENKTWILHEWEDSSVREADE